MYQVFCYALQYDAAFGGDAPPDTEFAELKRIWAIPDLSTIASVAPIGNWDQIRTGVRELTSTPADDLADEWIILVREAERLSSEHALAAAIGLTYALAALESVSKGDFYWSLADGARPDWHPVGVVFAQTLARLKAIWAADLFIRRAIDTIHATNRYRHAREKDITDRAAEYERLSAEVQRLRRHAVDSLSYDLVVRHSELAAPLAALLWTLGQPVDAEIVAKGDAPSRWVIESIIDDSLRRGDWDPLTQDTWRALDERFDFDLQRYPLLYGKLTQHVGPTLMRRIDSGSNPPVSQTYALAAIAHFEGAIDTEVKKRFEFIRDNWIPVLMPIQASDALRILALDALAFAATPTGGTEHMTELARAAPRLVENARSLGVIDYYDRSFDGIFGHLNVEPEPDLLITLDLIETYRVSGIGYWLVMTRPSLPDDIKAKALLEKEEALLEELRGARFVRQISELPRHYQKYTIDMDLWESFGNPFDQERAASRLQEIPTELLRLWAEMEKVVPDYATARRAPIPTLDEFALLLNPS